MRAHTHPPTHPPTPHTLMQLAQQQEPPGVHPRRRSDLERPAQPAKGRLLRQPRPDRRRARGHGQRRQPAVHVSVDGAAGRWLLAAGGSGADNTIWTLHAVVAGSCCVCRATAVHHQKQRPLYPSDTRAPLPATTNPYKTTASWPTPASRARSPPASPARSPLPRPATPRPPPPRPPPRPPPKPPRRPPPTPARPPPRPPPSPPTAPSSRSSSSRRRRRSSRRRSSSSPPRSCPPRSATPRSARARCRASRAATASRPWTRAAGSRTRRRRSRTRAATCRRPPPAPTPPPRWRASWRRSASSGSRWRSLRACASGCVPAGALVLHGEVDAHAACMHACSKIEAP